MTLSKRQSATDVQDQIVRFWDFGSLLSWMDYRMSQPGLGLGARGVQDHKLEPLFEVCVVIISHRIVKTGDILTVSAPNADPLMLSRDNTPVQRSNSQIIIIQKYISRMLTVI